MRRIIRTHVLPLASCLLLLLIASCNVGDVDAFGSPSSARSYPPSSAVNAPKWNFQRVVSRWPAASVQTTQASVESVKEEFVSEKTILKSGTHSASQKVIAEAGHSQHQTLSATSVESLNGDYTTKVTDAVQQQWDTIVGTVSQSAYSVTGYFETSIATCRHETLGMTWSTCGNLVIAALMMMIVVVVFVFKLIVGRGRFILPHGSVFDIRRLWRRGPLTESKAQASSSWKRRSALFAASSSATRDGSSKTWYNLSSSSTAVTSARGASCDDENVCRAKDDNYSSCSAQRLGDTSALAVPDNVQLSDEALSYFGQIFNGTEGGVSSSSAPTSRSSYVFGKIVSMLDQAIERPTRNLNLNAQCPKMKVPAGKPLAYEEAAALFKPLDLFCVRSDTIYSNVIQYIQMASRKCGHCTHSGYFIDTSVIQLPGMVKGELYVVESLVDILPNGVGLVKDVTGMSRNGVQIRSLREMMSAPEAEGCIFMGATLKPEIRQRLNDVIGHSRVNKSAPCKLYSATVAYLGKPYPMNPFNFMPGIDKHGITHRFADSIGASYFCSELVTTVYARMGILPAAMLQHARRVYPVDFLIDGILSPSSLFSSIHVIQ